MTESLAVLMQTIIEKRYQLAQLHLQRRELLKKFEELNKRVREKEDEIQILATSQIKREDDKDE